MGGFCEGIGMVEIGGGTSDMVIRVNKCDDGEGWKQSDRNKVMEINQK
jgi:hypothetical protein